MKRILFVFVLASSSIAAAQHVEAPSALPTWLALQAIPSVSWTTFPSQTNFAFEWEATPLLYSFGLSKLASPWKSFVVMPPARFTGSIEANVSVQLYTSAVGSTHWGFSGQLLAHLPLVERGEHLMLNIGGARYVIDRSASSYVIIGVGTLFSFLNYNIKYSPDDNIWMNAIEIRFF